VVLIRTVVIHTFVLKIPYAVVIRNVKLSFCLEDMRSLFMFRHSYHGHHGIGKSVSQDTHYYVINIFCKLRYVKTNLRLQPRPMRVKIAFTASLRPPTWFQNNETLNAD
jgi:hypothetical protein